MKWNSNKSWNKLNFLILQLELLLLFFASQLCCPHCDLPRRNGPAFSAWRRHIQLPWAAKSIHKESLTNYGPDKISQEWPGQAKRSRAVETRRWECRKQMTFHLFKSSRSSVPWVARFLSLNLGKNKLQFRVHQRTREKWIESEPTARRK